MFTEKRLVFLSKNSLEGNSKAENAEEGATMIAEDRATNTKEVQNIQKEQSELRDKIASNDLLTEQDKEKWDKKLEEMQAVISAEKIQQLKHEFEQEQSTIKSMVDTYTKKVIDNKEEAFAIDTRRNIDTAREYLQWFETQSYSEKQAALKALDNEIHERKTLRQKLLRKLDKKDVIKMRRSEMQNKLEELEVVENNTAHYKRMLQKDVKLFHDINLYIEAFEDLTPQEQEDWIRRYEKEIAKPRRELVKTHESLPTQFQHNDFLSFSSKEKRRYLESTEKVIEKQYIQRVQKIPKEIWSEQSKRFAIDDFIRLNSLEQKAQWLEFLPKAIKAEEKLAKEYKDKKFDAIKEMPDYNKEQWERAKFEEKQEMLTYMNAEVALMETFENILNKSLDDKVISKKTQERYMSMYTETDLSKRRMAVRTIMTALAPRRALLKDFEKLDPETQKKYASFYKRGHKARLELYKEAYAYDSKNHGEKKSEQKDMNPPEKLESKDIQEIVNNLQKQALTNEQTGNLEKALGLHEAVLSIHKDNEFSVDKVKQLKLELNALEAASDETVMYTIEQNLQKHDVQEEIKHLELAQKILEDQEDIVTRSHGNENLQKQHAHLGSDTFGSRVHENLVKQTHGKKVLDKSGKAKDVERVDLEYLGVGSDDPTKLKYAMHNKASSDNLENIQLVDSVAGKDISINEAIKQLNRRKEMLSKKIGDQKEEYFSVDEELSS